MKELMLRPHHLLCIQKYTGHGYDEKFTVHMNGLTEDIKKNPQMQVTLVQGCDYLCRECPNNCRVSADGGRECESEGKVGEIDRKVLELCGFHYEDRGIWQKLAERAKNEILISSCFENVCGKCQWYELCRNTPV